MTGQAPTATGPQEPRRQYRRLAVTLPLLLVSLAAMVVGIIDTLSPVSVQSQFLGVTYLVAGLAAAAGGTFIVVHGRSAPNITIIAAAAGAYLSLSVCLYAVGHREVVALVAGLLCLAILVGAAQMIRGGRWLFAGDAGPHLDPKLLSRLRFSAGAAAAVIAATQLWYSSIYLPNNVDVGMAFSVSLGTPLRVSSHLRLVPLEINLQNESSVGAIALTSMFTVRGVDYRGGKDLWRTRSTKLAAEFRIGNGSLKSEQDNNVAFSGHRPETLLTIGRVAGDGRELFPTVLQSTRVVVAVPSGVNALEVHAQLDYARESRLQLANANPATGLGGAPYARYDTSVPSCKRDVVEVRTLRQSLLQELTRGDQVLVTNWCLDHDEERTFSFVAQRPEGLTATVGANRTRAYDNQRRLVRGLRAASGNTYGIVHLQPVWTLPIQ